MPNSPDHMNERGANGWVDRMISHEKTIVIRVVPLTDKTPTYYPGDHLFTSAMTIHQFGIGKFHLRVELLENTFHISNDTTNFGPINE